MLGRAAFGNVPGSWLKPAVLFEEDRESSCLDEFLMIGSGLREWRTNINDDAEPEGEQNQEHVQR